MARHGAVCAKTADAGGSNGYRLRLWKLELQKLADETGLEIACATSHQGPASGTRYNQELAESRWLCKVTRPAIGDLDRTTKVTSTKKRAAWLPRVEALRRVLERRYQRLENDSEGNQHPQIRFKANGELPPAPWLLRRYPVLPVIQRGCGSPKKPLESFFLRQMLSPVSPCAPEPAWR